MKVIVEDDVFECRSEVDLSASNVCVLRLSHKGEQYVERVLEGRSLNDAALLAVRGIGYAAYRKVPE